MKAWAMYGVPIIGAVVVLAFVWNRDPGPAPQNLPISPYFGAEHGPGGTAFDLRTRGWAFLLIAVFWATMITGIVVNQVTPVG